MVSNEPPNPKQCIYKTLNEYDVKDAWDLAGLILDDLTDEYVQALAELREVESFTNELQRLHEENEQLEGEIEELRTSNFLCGDENQHLRDENQRLREVLNLRRTNA